MVPHHEAAVETAQQALENSDRAEVKELAQGIIGCCKSDPSILCF
ncbi:DUF305 domain-containing protein [Microcoleus sp. FACHB-1515]|nr:DUF305 domain-containing protein [Microcoleus sp. FACHB-1515]